MASSSAFCFAAASSGGQPLRVVGAGRVLRAGSRCERRSWVRWQPVRGSRCERRAHSWRSHRFGMSGRWVMSVPAMP